MCRLFFVLLFRIDEPIPHGILLTSLDSCLLIYSINHSDEIKSLAFKFSASNNVNNNSGIFTSGIISSRLY